MVCTHPLIVSNDIVSEMLNVPETSASDVLTDREVASMFCVEVVISAVGRYVEIQSGWRKKERKKGEGGEGPETEGGKQEM